MSSSYCRKLVYGACLIAVMALLACTAAPAAKVRCDTDLQPINPPQHQLP